MLDLPYYKPETELTVLNAADGAGLVFCYNTRREEDDPTRGFVTDWTILAPLQRLRDSNIDLFESNCREWSKVIYTANAHANRPVKTFPTKQELMTALKKTLREINCASAFDLPPAYRLTCKEIMRQNRKAERRGSTVDLTSPKRKKRKRVKKNSSARLSVPDPS